VSQPHAPLAARRRPVLPVSTEGLPELGAPYDAIVQAAEERLHLDLDDAQRRALDAHARLLLAWSGAINLTAIRTAEGIAREHVADSLSAIPLLRSLAAPEPDLLDLGSGPGYPGLPLAICLPAGRAGLVESIGKKARFLEAAAAVARSTLGEGARPVPRLDVLARRAEELGTEPAEARRWDVVTARAVGSLERLLVLAGPFLREGGLLIAWKRDAGDGRLDTELEAARPRIDAWGGGPGRVEPVEIEGLEDHRLVIVRRGGRGPDRPPAQTVRGSAPPRPFTRPPGGRLP
jgi:16S rRNA (guanine527-N7)-methyltransferase